MTSVPPTQPPAAPETDVRLTDDERTILTAHFWGRRITANATHLADLIAPAVERIVAERVRVVEGERDALIEERNDLSLGWVEEVARAEKAEAERDRAEAAHRALQAAVEALADEWVEDYPGPTAACNRTPDEWARDLRALLAGGAR